MKLKIPKIIPMSTDKAEVPATTNMGSPTTLVRNGTYRKPPPTPIKEAMAEITKPPTKAQSGLKALLSRYDYNEYGGAPLLGVGGICIICHGASSHRGIMNAVRVAKEFARCGVNDRITKLLSVSEGPDDA